MSSNKACLIPRELSTMQNKLSGMDMTALIWIISLSDRSGKREMINEKSFMDH